MKIAESYKEKTKYEMQPTKVYCLFSKTLFYSSHNLHTYIYAIKV